MRLRSSSLSLFRSSSKRPMSSKVFLVPAVGLGLPSRVGVKLYRYWLLVVRVYRRSQWWETSVVVSSSRVERVGDRLVIVGTVHVDPSSVSQARDVISSVRPGVVALELDETRLRALIDPSTRNVGAVGRVASSGLSVLLMAVLERFAGRLTGSAPGMEMLG